MKLFSAALVSLPTQGEQRRPPYFNIRRDIPGRPIWWRRCESRPIPSANFFCKRSDAKSARKLRANPCPQHADRTPKMRRGVYAHASR